METIGSSRFFLTCIFTPPEELEVVLIFGVLRGTEMFNLVLDRLLKLDIKICLSSDEIFESAFFP